VFKKLIDQPRYNSADSSLAVFNKYAYSFGLGRHLGVDIPTERKGNIPTSNYYRKIFGPKWVSCNIISNSIGQGEVETTLTQLANVMVTIANKGWYYTPHLVDSIAGGDEFHLLDSLKIKHRTLDIPQHVFETVHDGMQSVMEIGTGRFAKVPGVISCGKTGTVQNPFGRDHAFFGAFAPRENPRIAIAVMCENAGFGASSAAPIASLMMEKYLNDSIAGKERQAKIEVLSKMNLIPERMRKAMFTMDSIKRVKDSIQLRIKAQKAVKDTIDVEEQPENEVRSRPTDTTKPKKDSGDKNNIRTSSPAVTPEEKKHNRKTSTRT
jgi:penicillin-binding protein 2